MDEATQQGAEVYAANGQYGLYMDYPTLDEVKHFVRDLPFDQRVSLLTQGFHRGTAYAHCYNMKEFVETLSKREFDNPAGGVRDIDFDVVCPWLRNVVGDGVLADALETIRTQAANMAEAADRTRLTVFVRVEQYNEVLSDLSAEEREALGR